MATLGDLDQLTGSIAENDRIGVWDTSAGEGYRDKYISPQQVRDIVLGAANTFTADQSISGKLGIGTPSPSQALHLYTATGSIYARIESAQDNADAGLQLSNDNIEWQIVNDKANGFLVFRQMRDVVNLFKLSDTGQLAVGPQGPRYLLDLNAVSNYPAWALLQASGSKEAGVRLKNTLREWLIYNVEDDGRFSIYDNTASAERLSIDASGATTVGGTLGVSGSLLYIDDSNAKVRVGQAGNSGTVGYEFHHASNIKNAIVSVASGTWGRGKLYFIQDMVHDGNSYELSDVKMAIVDGKVGIGTTSPAAALHVANGTIRADSAAASATVLDGRTADYIETPNNRQSIKLGTTNSSPGREIEFGYTNSQTWGQYPAFYISTAGSERLRVSHAGNVGIGTTSPSYKLDVSGDINASGSVRSNGTPLTSDGTLKDAPTPTKAALSKLAAVRGYEFTWSDKARQMGLPEGTQHGLIAQEVEQIFPDLVSEWEVETGEYIEGDDGEQMPVKERIKCIDYARMVPILLEAVRELAARVDALNDTDPTTKE
jgi:hypothetical protein